MILCTDWIVVDKCITSFLKFFLCWHVHHVVVVKRIPSHITVFVVVCCCLLFVVVCCLLFVVVCCCCCCCYSCDGDNIFNRNPNANSPVTSCPTGIFFQVTPTVSICFFYLLLSEPFLHRYTMCVNMCITALASYASCLLRWQREIETFWIHKFGPVNK